MPKYTILDCDGGSDDAWALLTLLKADSELDVKLLAVTVTGGGNTTVENAARNMWRILNASKRTDIPIYLGAVEPLLPPNERDAKTYFHGKDGFGDILDPTECPTLEQISNKKHAVTAIWDLCHQYDKQVTVFVVGPLTNIALGYSMYGGKFGSQIKSIYIMGGNYQGVGNSSRAAEFNFHSDPEAAHAVLARSESQLTILPWEACTLERFSINISWRLNVFGEKIANTHNAIALLNRVESAQWLLSGFQSWNPCDAMLIAAYLFDDKFIIRKNIWHATVELQGIHTRGQMVLDHLHETDKNAENVCIIEQVDSEFFKQIVEWIAGLRTDFISELAISKA